MKILRHTEGNFSAYGRKKIFLREEINFLPYENKFLCGRKNIFLREEISFFPTLVSTLPERGAVTTSKKGRTGGGKLIHNYG